MNNFNIIHQLLQLNIKTLILEFVIVALAYLTIRKIMNELLRHSGLETPSMKHSRNLQKLSLDMDEIKQRRQEDVKQSIAHDKRLEEKLDSFKTDMDLLAAKLDSMAKEQRKTTLAQLKDRISHSYRYYHKKQVWDLMEKESFEDLINQYEANGGTNSFVHSVVIPEMHTWTITESKYKKTP